VFAINTGVDEQLRALSLHPLDHPGLVSLRRTTSKPLGPTRPYLTVSLEALYHHIPLSLILPEVPEESLLLGIIHAQPGQRSQKTLFLTAERIFGSFLQALWIPFQRLGTGYVMLSDA
jgi:hypothetical protein